MEEEVSVSGSALPWYWVIETLARSQLEGVTPLLYELVSRAPPSSSDSARKAREALSLRCLEELFGPCSGLSDDLRASNQSGKGFDLAESCDDVLQWILHEASGLDLRKHASDELKRDVRSFIKCKKASLPRSTLELLKNAVVVGTHPLVASLKEISGVALPNQCVSGVPFSGIDPKSPLQTIDEDHGSQAVLPEQHNDSTRTGIGNKPTYSQIPNGNSLHSEEDASAFCNDSLAQDTDGTSYDLKNNGPSEKKHNLDQQSKECEQNPVPSGGTGEQSNAEQEHQSPKANGKHDREFDWENFNSADKINVNDHNQPHTLSDDNAPLPREIDLQTKLSFLSSQCAFSEDSLTLADSDINLCMKCSKGGVLLICSSSSCPLAFHDSCLGFSATFDDLGNFYCPFCAYSRAISEYVRVKKKASLARRELSLFIGGRTSCQSEHNSKRALKDYEIDQRGQDEDVDNAAELENHVNVVTQVANPHLLGSSKGKKRKFSTPSAPLAEPNDGKPEKFARVVNQLASPRQLRSSKFVEMQKSSAQSTPQAEQKNGANVVTRVANCRQLRSSSKGK